MLDTWIDAQRLRQYFNVAVRGRQLLESTRRDVGFLTSLRRGLLPLPTDPAPRVPDQVFPPLEPFAAPALAGRRVGLVGSGGSGALASVVGVARAMEEAGHRFSVLSLCSGSAMFGFPLAAGLTAEQTARFVLGLRPRDYVRVAWGPLLRLPFTLGRGFTGLLDGGHVEDVYRQLLGDRRLGDLDIPAYAVVWNAERNEVDYVGPRTHPDLPVATAVRLAIALPLLIEAVELDGEHWCDGGIVDVFPVRPVLDIEPRCDVVVGVNGFYPSGFRGDDITGFTSRPATILHAAGQVRTMQHLHVARQQVARLEAECQAIVLQPVPHGIVEGTGLYREFLDSRRWAGFMEAGRTTARAALATARPRRRRAAPAS